tara:strand:+ start:293 stop:451 length:159 start_codon:yes stop_codon:yes gene_type:complete
MGSTKKTRKGRFVTRAEIKNEDRRMRRKEAKEEITNEMYHYADWVITGDEEE